MGTRLAIRSAGCLVVLAAAASACSSGSNSDQRGAAPDAGTSTAPSVAATPGAGGTQQVTINATNEFRFAPETITAHPGDLKVTLVDTGSYPHNLSVDALHFTSKTVSGNTGEQSTTFTLHLDHAGSYQFVCTFHSSAGMRGQFIVK